MALRRWHSKRATRVYHFRYERADGQFREIAVPVGRGRFRLGSEAEAKEIAERRLSEQFGDACLAAEARRREAEPGFTDPAAEVLRGTFDLHQDYYELVETRRG